MRWITLKAHSPKDLDKAPAVPLFVQEAWGGLSQCWGLWCMGGLCREGRARRSSAVGEANLPCSVSSHCLEAPQSQTRTWGGWLTGKICKSNRGLVAVWMVVANTGAAPCCDPQEGLPWLPVLTRAGAGQRDRQCDQTGFVGRAKAS